MNHKGKGSSFDKAKDFKGSIKRLIIELGNYKLLIVISIFLAFLGSVLSIISPNRLSDMTDEISKGLIVNTKNVKKLSKEIMNNKTYNDITINNVTISYKDQIEFITLMSKYNKDSDVSEMYKEIDKLPKNIRKVIEPKMNLTNIKKIALFLGILYILSALFTYIESIIMATVSNNFANELREKISKKINRLPLNYFDKHSVGDTMSRVTNDVDTIAQSMNQSLSTLVSSITLFLGTLLMMFITNSIMALTAVFSSLFGFIFMGLILKNSQKYFKARQKELGNLNGHIEEIYSGLSIVKVYNGVKESNKKFDKYNEKVYNATKMSQFLSGIMHAYDGIYR